MTIGFPEGRPGRHLSRAIIEMEGYKVVVVKDSEGNTIEIAQVPSGS